MKIFSKLLTQGYALKKINGVDENTVREKICVESLAVIEGILFLEV